MDGGCASTQSEGGEIKTPHAAAPGIQNLTAYADDHLLSVRRWRLKREKDKRGHRKFLAHEGCLPRLDGGLSNLAASRVRPRSSSEVVVFFFRSPCSRYVCSNLGLASCFDGREVRTPPPSFEKEEDAASISRILRGHI